MKKKQREKIREANNDLNKESDDLEKETKKLSQSVADAATGLCRKMLRYKGNYHFKCEIRLDLFMIFFSDFV